VAAVPGDVSPTPLKKRKRKRNSAVQPVASSLCCLSYLGSVRIIRFEVLKTALAIKVIV
jgi:hypothetical protein